ncbi:MAG: Fur family transcriptional regulator [Minisyncoccales bacterium]
MKTSQEERLTSQKKVIWDYLKNVKSHPTAEDVYLTVKKRLPQISRGTVYRHLKNLKEKGEILEIFSKVSHYDGYVSSHAHFVCQKCDRIFDIFDVCRECKIVKKKRIKLGKIQGYNLNFYGICKNCQKNEKH